MSYSQEQLPISDAAENPSLSSRVRSGASWMALSALFIHGLSLVRSIVLARLLSQDDFGLFGMALTMLGALTVLTNLGMEGSVIVGKFQSTEKMNDHLDTIWTVEVIRRFLLSLLLLATVYPTAHFYGEPRLLEILPILSMVPFLEGLGNIGLVVLRRQVNLASVVKFDISCAIVQTVLPFALALWFGNVWALVWGQVVAVALSSFFSYFFYRYRPRFFFDKAAFGQAFQFGKYMFVIGIMSYINTTADNIVVGKLWGTEILGVYLVAYSMASLPSTIFGRIFASILFPAYSELVREGGERLVSAVLRVFLLASSILVLIIGPIALLSNELVTLLYGDKWQAAGPVLQILTLMTLWRGLLHLVGPLLLSLNRPDLEARSKVLESLFFLSVLLPLTAHMGTTGAAWAGVLVSTLSFLLRFSFVRNLVPAASAHVPLLMGKAVIAGLAGMIAGQMALSWAATPLLRCLLGWPVCFCVTLGLLWFIHPQVRSEIGTISIQLRGRFRRKPSV